MPHIPGKSKTVDGIHQRSWAPGEGPQVALSVNTLALAQKNLEELRSGKQKMGAYFKEAAQKFKTLRGFKDSSEQDFLARLTVSDYLVILFNSKKPVLYAESDLRLDGNDWTGPEAAVLEAMSTAFETDVYDNGVFYATKETAIAYDSPRKGFFISPNAPLYTDGCLEHNQNQNPARATIIDGSIDKDRYIYLMEERLGPAFAQSQEFIEKQRARYKKEHPGKPVPESSISVAGLGLGQFAGNYKQVLPNLLNQSVAHTLQRGKFDLNGEVVLSMWENRKGVTSETHGELCSADLGNGTKFSNVATQNYVLLDRPNKTIGLWENFAPGETVAKVVFTAGDAYAYATNDALLGSRATADGGLGGATSIPQNFLGVEGAYYQTSYHVGFWKKESQWIVYAESQSMFFDINLEDLKIWTPGQSKLVPIGQMGPIPQPVVGLPQEWKQEITPPMKSTGRKLQVSDQAPYVPAPSMEESLILFESLKKKPDLSISKPDGDLIAIFFVNDVPLSQENLNHHAKNLGARSKGKSLIFNITKKEDLDKLPLHVAKKIQQATAESQALKATEKGRAWQESLLPKLFSVDESRAFLESLPNPPGLMVTRNKRLMVGFLCKGLNLTRTELEAHAKNLGCKLDHTTLFYYAEALDNLNFLPNKVVHKIYEAAKDSQSLKTTDTEGFWTKEFRNHSALQVGPSERAEGVAPVSVMPQPPVPQQEKSKISRFFQTLFTQDITEKQALQSWKAENPESKFDASWLFKARLWWQFDHLRQPLVEALIDVKLFGKDRPQWSEEREKKAKEAENAFEETIKHPLYSLANETLSTLFKEMPQENLKKNIDINGAVKNFFEDNNIYDTKGLDKETSIASVLEIKKNGSREDYAYAIGLLMDALNGSEKNKDENIKAAIATIDSLAASLGRGSSGTTPVRVKKTLHPLEKNFDADQIRRIKEEIPFDASRQAIEDFLKAQNYSEIFQGVYSYCEKNDHGVPGRNVSLRIITEDILVIQAKGSENDYYYALALVRNLKDLLENGDPTLEQEAERTTTELIKLASKNHQPSAQPRTSGPSVGRSSQAAGPSHY